MLGDIKFLESLKTYDKDNIPQGIMKKIREKYVTNPYFDPNLVKKVSTACVLFYLPKNARDLRELIVAIRSNIINDNYVQRLVRVCQLEKLQKILFVVPHRYSLPGILKLTINTVHTLMRLCPDLNKLGNILSWTVASEVLAEVQSNINDENYDIEIVTKL